MSIKVEAIFDGKEYIVEVFENADIIVHGYNQEDMEYDLSMVEFGDKVSSLLLFIKHCEAGEKASSLVGWSLDRKRYYKEIVLFGADCVLRALRECVRAVSAKAYGPAMDLLKLAVAFINSYPQFPGGNQLIREDLVSLNEEAMGICEEAEESSDIVTEYVLRAATIVAKCAMDLEAVSDGKVEVESMFSYPPMAVGFAFESEEGRTFEEITAREDEWQIKRFVKCMKLVLTGLNWPSLGEIK